MNEIVIVGIPNSGKTTLFNKLTGEKSKTGNFPGITVEIKKSTLKNKKGIVVTDLPGLYSLSSGAGEENTALSYLKENIKKARVLFIIDIENLYISLYLLLDFIFLFPDIPYVFYVSKTSEKKENNLKTENIKKQLYSVFGIKAISKTKEILSEIEKPQNAFKNRDISYIFTKNCRHCFTKSLTSKEKYSFIKRNFPITPAVFTKTDKLLTHKILGLPIAFLVIFSVFFLSFYFGGILGDKIEEYIKKFFLEKTFLYSGSILESFLKEGIFPGVFSLLKFFPIFTLLFFLTALIEDSGYLARISYLFDGVFHSIGLSGKTAVSVFLGFGCTVPAVLSARTASSKIEQIKTIFFLPFVSCTAKIPVYLWFACEIFSEVFRNPYIIIPFAYVLSLIFGIIILSITNCNKNKNDKNSSFIIMLPQYKIPDFKIAFKESFEKIKEFFIRVFLVVVLFSGILWFMYNFNTNLEFTNSSKENILSTISKVFLPIFYPLGITDYRAVSALICGFFAKETFVSSLAVTGGISPMNISTSFSFLIFTLLYTPCISTVIAVRNELGKKSAIIFTIRQFLIAYAASLLFKNIFLGIAVFIVVLAVEKNFYKH